MSNMKTLVELLMELRQRIVSAESDLERLRDEVFSVESDLSLMGSDLQQMLAELEAATS